MATKTFKIGLSNTDKQNMAQDVYERLIAMCFDEYDSTKTYNKGDFVVYENPNDTFKLYKCIADSTTGTWDSEDWELATFQDLVDDIESAVAFVNDKANVDGNYPTMTVGMADNLTPYDKSAGDDQDDPFSFQATGTGNGSQSDFATGSSALMKEKRGNTVVVNQWNRFKDDYTTQTINGVSLVKNNDGSVRVHGTASADAGFSFANTGLTYHFTVKENHYYLYHFTDNKITGVAFGIGGYGFTYDKTTIANIRTSGGDWENGCLQVQVLNGTTVDFTFKPFAIDLTQMFNGDIPQDLLDNPENFFRYYQGSLAYNAGELVNANGRYIKCIGRQQWEEQGENGDINANTGAKSGTGRFISSNLIKVIPNNEYITNNSALQTIYFYDKDSNYIGYTNPSQNKFTTPSNAEYIMFRCAASYGTTYKNDITISLYYEGESGYDQYYPYEVLTNNDTGTETLRSAGSVCDIKLPDGTITRRVGTYTFTGSETVYYSSEYDFFTVACDINGVAYTTNVIIVGYDPVVSIGNDKWTQIDGNGAGIRLANHSLNGDTNALLTSLIGKSFNYELATPITEQGTLFSENLVIDDFGSMEFSGSSGVPQGNLIFYPVDYKAFIDTLYDYTEGTPSDIALKSDLTSDKTELQGVDSQLLNAIGGTLRNVLAVKESLDFDNTDFVDLDSLSGWTIGGTYNNMVYAYMSGATSKVLCSKYKTYSYSSLNVNDNTTIGIAYRDDGTVRIKDPSLLSMTIDQIKDNLKGVLLAYEKASE